ncbi:hypothetical protein BC826DRAFT_1026346, partial [Russula brevipes]
MVGLLFWNPSINVLRWGDTVTACALTRLTVEHPELYIGWEDGAPGDHDILGPT